MGSCNVADGTARYSFTGGQCSDNFSEGGIAFGCGATASRGRNQFAFGTGVNTPTTGTCACTCDQFVVGRYNVYSGATAHLFAVGCGTSDGTRRNALNVTTNGRLGLGVQSIFSATTMSNSANKPSSSLWSTFQMKD